VELLALQGRETDRRIDQVTQAIEKLFRIVSTREQRLDRLDVLEGA